MEQLIDRVASLRATIKVGVMVTFTALLTAFNYFVAAVPTFGAPVIELEHKIQTAVGQQRVLDQEYVEKQGIANNLNEFRRERDRLEQRLKEALAELPDDKRIDELLQAFQDRALKAGLDIQTIEPQPQVNEGFYARIPIPMMVQGDYHEVATFLDAIGRLQRIVNVNNLTFDQPRDLNGRVVLNARFLATTFMFVEAKDTSNVKPAPGAPK